MGVARVGIGGWTYEPWRGTFYPEGTRQKDELAYASAHLTAIEINGTYYGSQKPQTFAGWARAVPDGFKFTVKASRFCTNRRVLAEAGESVDRFVNQGISELGDKLGPILWQFAATKQFDADDMAAFIALLPGSVAGIKLRHAFEVRNESFRDAAFTALMKKANAAIVFADHPEYPCIDEDTADFTYARLMKTVEEEPLGYGDAALDGWADRARQWSTGGDAFVFFISGAKVRAGRRAGLDRAAEGMSTVFEVSTPAWIWRPAPPAKGAWHFLTIDAQTAVEIRYEALGRTGGFGSVKVMATIGETRWYTSLFPHKSSGGFILPLKADVRRNEGVVEGDMVTVRIEI